MKVASLEHCRILPGPDILTSPIGLGCMGDLIFLWFMVLRPFVHGI
jgi:hypothetical protein